MPSATPDQDRTSIEVLPVDTYWIVAQGFPPSKCVLTAPQVAELLDISHSTLRGWISRSLFPPCDGELNGKAQFWTLKTVVEYVRNAPGGRLAYPVG